ncbi:MAG: metallophosphatase domain-containing protein [Prevotellaceae bacterium]|nr:metallophosphatase domain-containing protein [Prevotellaceae bacterium]
MKILQISDTHNRHRQLTNLPEADVIVHCGDFADNGTEEEVLDFLNWYIDLPYKYKIFVTGNHDLCLWDAKDIEDLPENVFFLQDRGVTIEGVKFFGIAYNHSERLIPEGTDIVITHEPPIMILDESAGIHWGDVPLFKRIMEVRPRYHLFGHAHESCGTLKQDDIIFSNGAILDDFYHISHQPKVFLIDTNTSTPKP